MGKGEGGGPSISERHVSRETMTISIFLEWRRTDLFRFERAINQHLPVEQYFIVSKCFKIKVLSILLIMLPTLQPQLASFPLDFIFPQVYFNDIVLQFIKKYFFPLFFLK